MTVAQFDLHRLVLVPLTPIHIGGGEEARLRPEDYRLKGGHAERVAIRAVLARLPEAERRAWIETMAKVDIGAADSVVAQAIARLQGKATAAEVIERIPISDASARAVDLSGEGRNRRNQIDAFFRAGGAPTLPGSSLKGALRTAWAAAMARLYGAPGLPDLRAWQGMGKRDRARAAAGAIERLFGLASDKRAQDTDPFRDVAVADAPLPEGATRIDPVQTWKKQPVRDGAAAYGFGSVGQMHRERMRSVADGGPPPVVELTLGLRTAAVRAAAARLDRAKRPTEDRTPGSLAALLAALEAHHAPLWRNEVEAKFFAGPPGDRLRQTLALFGGFRRDGDAPEAALIRLGWAGHAEAKSLAGLRRIERPQARGEGRIASEGSTRHVVNLNGHPLPFGWALLIRAEVWAARAPGIAWLPQPAPRAAPAAGPARGTATDPRAQTALGQQLRYRKGHRVLLVDGEVAELLDDVTAAARPTDEVRIRLAGDTEVIRVQEIKGPA